MNRKFSKRIVSILLVTMLIITLPITNLHRTEAAVKKVKIKFFVCSGTFKADIDKGKKSTVNTKIKKKTKLYAHWVKKYIINRKYEKILGVTSYPTLNDIERDTGKLKFLSEDKKYYPFTETYRDKNGDVYCIYAPSEMSTPDYVVSDVTIKAKHLINIKKPTKYKTFLKKLGVKEYNKTTKKKKWSLDFVTGTVNLVYEDPEENEWQYVKWEVKGIKDKKVTPDTKITLCLEEDWERV